MSWNWNLPLDEYCPRVITHLSVASYLSGIPVGATDRWVNELSLGTLHPMVG